MKKKYMQLAPLSRRQRKAMNNKLIVAFSKLQPELAAIVLLTVTARTIKAKLGFDLTAGDADFLFKAFAALELFLEIPR